jgi:hypothetical protein
VRLFECYVYRPARPSGPRRPSHPASSEMSHRRVGPYIRALCTASFGWFTERARRISLLHAGPLRAGSPHAPGTAPVIDQILPQPSSSITPLHRGLARSVGMRVCGDTGANSRIDNFQKSPLRVILVGIDAASAISASCGGHLD